MNANQDWISTFNSEGAAKNYLRLLCGIGRDMAMVAGPCDGEFTVMPVADAEEFGFYTTATRSGNLCTVKVDCTGGDR